MRTPSSPRAERIRSRVVTSRSPVRGSCGRYPIVPLRLTVPAAGNASPARILVRVVLPAPLRPTRPIVSPGFTGNDTGLSRSLAPARTSTFVTVSTTDHSSRPAQYGRTAFTPPADPSSRSHDTPGTCGVSRHEPTPRLVRKHTGRSIVAATQPSPRNVPMPASSASRAGAKAGSDGGPDTYPMSATSTPLTTDTCLLYTSPSP